MYTRGPEIIDFEQLSPTVCPCGLSRRALVDRADFPATIHRTDISEDAKPHYHRRVTETYYILDCDDDARMELDGRRVSVRPGLCILIPPGTIHRAVGRMRVLIFVLPKFDPDDEFVVEDSSP